MIWHVHIALIPTLLTIPFAFILSKKLPSPKKIIQFLIYFFVTSLPLFAFEIKHGFQQSQALISNLTTSKEGSIGLYKLILVLNMISKNINYLLFAPQSFKLTENLFFIFIILFSAVILMRKKILLYKELIIFYIWILAVLLFFGLSNSPISEYYFSNINIIFLTLVSLFIYLLFNSSKIGKLLTLSILGIILIKNSYFLINQDFYHKGYREKKAAVDFITLDAKKKLYPCIGVSYITTPGENVGFRYFFYLKNQHLVHPSLDVPVYNIVIPDELSLNEVKQKFGHIGIIPPVKIPPKEVIEKTCQTPNTNLTDSMFGYVD